MTKNFKTTTPISQVNNIYSQSAFDYEAIVLEDTVQNTQAEKPNTFPSTSGQVLTASLSKQNRSRNAALSRTATNTGNKYQDKKQMATKSKLSLSVKSQKVKPLFFNGCFDKTRIKRLVAWSLQNCGQKLTIDLIENLKNLGFSYATHAGISLGIDDLKIPPTKNILLSSAEKNIKKTYINHEKEYLTGVEKFQHLIDTWHRTSEVLKQDVISHFKLTDILNPVYMMAFSGARGNVSQVRQLVGMRGLMSDPQGQILDFPIKSNFREGITLTEYIISCYGARKGLVDTALKTANSGYLTRRLVDVSHHIIISDLDCKTKRGVLLADIFENKKIIVPLKNRLVGRILAENIYSNNTTIGNTRVFDESANSHIFSENPKGLNSQYQNVSSLYQVPRYFASFISASQKTYHPKKRLGTKLFRVQAQSTLFFYLVTKYNIFDILYKKTDAQEILENQLVFNVPRNTTTINSANKAIVFQAETTKQVDTEYVIFSNYLTCYTTKKKLLGQKNQEISVELSLKISNLRKSVLVRSPLTCRIKNSICQLCYGWSLAHSQLVSLGEAVGVLAAQSIGEPGTQLTMRTFHTGGVFSGDIMSEITAPFNGKISFSNFLEGMLIRTPHGKIAFLTKVPGNFKIEKQELQAVSFPKNAENLLPGTEYKKKDSIVLQIPAFTVLFVRNAEYVNKNQVIAEFSSMSADANQRIQASQDINSEIEGEVYFKNLLLLVRKKKKKLISRTTCKLGSMWILSGKICQQPIPINLFLQPGDLVNENSIIAQYQTMSVYSGFNSSYSTLDPVNKNRSGKQVINSYSVHQHKMGLKQNISKHIVPGFDSEAVKTKLKALKPQTTFGAKHPKDFWYKAPQVRSKIQPGTEYKIFDRPAIWKSDHVPGTEISGALRTLQNQVRSTNSSKNLNFDNKNWLGYPLLSYSVQSIQYKKVGYLFSFFTKKKLQFNFLSQKIVTKSLILCKAESPKGLAFGESLKGLCEAESPKGLIEGESLEGQVPSTSLVFAQHSKPLCGHVRSTSARNAQVRSTLVSNKDFVPTDFTGLSLKQPVLKQHRFFLSNSLKQNFLHSNNLNKKFFLQSFPIKYQTKTGGKIIYDTFYFNKKKYLGEVFWIQQEACLLNRKNSYINLINYLLRVFTSKQASGLSTSVREAHRYPVPVRAWDFVHSRSGSKESIVLLCEPTIQTKTISGLLNKTNTKFISQNNLTSFYYNAQGRVFASYSKLSGYTEYSLLSRFIHNKIKQAVPKAKNNSLKKFSKTPVIPNNSEIQEKPEVRSEIQPRTEYQGLMLDKCTIKKAIQNNKVYSFNYKFYQICFHLNPCITISCKARRTLKIKNAIKRKNIFLLFENVNQKNKAQIRSAGFLQHNKKINFKLRAPGRLLSLKNSKNITATRLQLEKANKDQRIRSVAVCDNFKSTISSALDTQSKKITRKLFTKQRFILLRPQFPWKSFKKSVKKFQNQSPNGSLVQRTQSSFANIFFYNEREKNILTNVLINRSPKFEATEWPRTEYQAVSFSQNAENLWPGAEYKTINSKQSLPDISNMGVRFPQNLENLRLKTPVNLSDSKLYKQSTKLKERLIKVTIKPGWVYLQDTGLKDSLLGGKHHNVLSHEQFSQIIKKDKKIIKPGEICFTNISFDQYPVYYQCLSVKQISLQKNKSVIKKNNILQKQKQFINISEKFINSKPRSGHVRSTSVRKVARYKVSYTSSQNSLQTPSRSAARYGVHNLNLKPLCDQMQSILKQKTVVKNLHFFKLCHNLFFNKKFYATWQSSTKYNQKKFYENNLDIISEKILLQKNIKKNYLPNQINVNKIYFLKNVNFLKLSSRNRFKQQSKLLDYSNQTIRTAKSNKLQKSQTAERSGTEYKILGTKFLQAQVQNSKSPAKQVIRLKQTLCPSWFAAQMPTHKVDIVYRNRSRWPESLAPTDEVSTVFKNGDSPRRVAPRYGVQLQRNQGPAGPSLVPSTQGPGTKLIMVITKVKCYSFNNLKQYKKSLAQDNKIVPSTSTYFSDPLIPNATHVNNTKQMLSWQYKTLNSPIYSVAVEKHQTQHHGASKFRVQNTSSYSQSIKLLDSKIISKALSARFSKLGFSGSRQSRGYVAKNVNTLSTPKYNYNRQCQIAFYMRLWSSNKQNITHLFIISPAPDFYLKFSFKHQDRKNVVFYKPTSIFQYYISFIIPKNYKRHFTKISLVTKNKNCKPRSDMGLEAFQARAKGVATSKAQSTQAKTWLQKTLKQNLKNIPLLSKGLKDSPLSNGLLREYIIKTLLLRGFVLGTTYNLNLSSRLNVFIHMEVDSHLGYKKPLEQKLALPNSFSEGTDSHSNFQRKKTFVTTASTFKPKNDHRQDTDSIKKIQLFFSSQNYVTSETPLSYTNLLSQYSGEILNSGVFIKRSFKNLDPKTNTAQIALPDGSFRETVLDVPENQIEKQNYLTLTCNDQVNFYIDGQVKSTPSSPVFLGKNIRYGTKIKLQNTSHSDKNFVIPLSGSIIQIEKSKPQSAHIQALAGSVSEPLQTLTGGGATVLTFRKAQPILFSSKGLVSVYEGDIIEKNTLVLRLFYQRLKTGDIVQGIPKIEQLFEARKTNQGEPLSNSLHEQLEKIFLYYLHLPSPTVRASKKSVVDVSSTSKYLDRSHLEVYDEASLVSNKSLEPSTLTGSSSAGTLYFENLKHRARKNYATEPDKASEIGPDKASTLVVTDRFSKASRYSLSKIQEIIVSSVQKVYRSQGVIIADKHLEIIIKQMTSKVQVLSGGQTSLLSGEIVDLDWIEGVNEIIEDMNKKAKYVPVILGITRKSLETKSFISEASFQETTRVLAKSAIERKTDFLKGLKENVILGNLIPAGTGFLSLGEDHLFVSNKRVPKQASVAKDGLDNLESYTLFETLVSKNILKSKSLPRRYATRFSMLRSENVTE